MRATLLIIALSIFAAAGALLPRAVGSTSGPNPSPTPAGFKTVKEYLITSAAADFTDHQPPYPAKFRKVKIGYMGDTTKSGAWRLCGEFFPTTGMGGEKPAWTGFATVKTSGYGQYIGSGSNYCTDPKIVWVRTTDLAPELKRKLDSLKKAQ